MECYLAADATCGWRASLLDHLDDLLPLNDFGFLLFYRFVGCLRLLPLDSLVFRLLLPLNTPPGALPLPPPSIGRRHRRHYDLYCRGASLLIRLLIKRKEIIWFFSLISREERRKAKSGSAIEWRVHPVLPLLNSHSADLARSFFM